jgi:hypothetical protein
MMHPVISSLCTLQRAVARRGKHTEWRRELEELQARASDLTGDTATRARWLQAARALMQKRLEQLQRRTLSMAQFELMMTCTRLLDRIEDQLHEIEFAPH